MIEWDDKGIVLAASPMGEHAAKVSLLTAQHGRHLGSLPYGQSQKTRALLQAGAEVSIQWRARLESQMGVYTLEPAAPYPFAMMDDPMALACLSSACALLDACLPEREPHPALFAALQALLQTKDLEALPYAYVKWEVGVLQDVGYGIQLERCAATGKAPTDDDPFTHVSPRSGRAVCQSAALPYAEKLLPLPPFLLGVPVVAAGDLQNGLDLTGYFLERYAFAVHHARLPSARYRLRERIFEQVFDTAS